MKSQFDKLFDPKTVAVIGASPLKDKVGYSLFWHVSRDKKRKIYPVSPTFKKVLGKKCFKSVLDIPEKIDLAVIAIRAAAVPQALEDCGKKQIPFAVIISAGFKETGAEGKALEDQITSVAKQYGIAVVGPNCLGIINANAGFNASFTVEEPLAGGISFVSQSGAIGTAMLDWARKEGIGFSKFISIGNKAVLNENDFLEYLAGDPKTKAVLLYLEGVSDGKKFMSLAAGVARNKPLIVLKAGRSARGQAAVASHTGSLAPQDKIFDAACRQAGAVTVNSLRGLFGIAKLLQIGISRSPQKLAVLTNGGGPSIVLADMIDLSPSLELATLPEKTKKLLRAALPPMAAVGNPVDIIGDALADRFEAALKILSAENGIDGIIAIVTPQQMTEMEKTAGLFCKYGKIKPLISMFIGGDAVANGVEVLKKKGLCNFTFPADAVEALEALGPKKVTRKKMDVLPAPIADANSQSGRVMDFAESAAFLKQYGIEVPGRVVRSKDELAPAFASLGGAKAAMKIISPDAIHKTDMGGVKTNIASLEEAEAAWDKMSASIKARIPSARIDGFAVQPMVKGCEVIIGMKRDPYFGAVIVFGIGGILVEVLKDVSMRISPLTDADAEEMLYEIKGVAILEGARGARPVDFGALKKLLLDVSHIAEAHSEVREIDLNPVMASDVGAIAVDARIVTD
jgi:acetate---CoA ligase (ADP-forming)